MLEYEGVTCIEKAGERDSESGLRSRVAGGGMQKGQHVCLFHVLVRSNFSSLYKNILVDVNFIYGVTDLCFI